MGQIDIKSSERIDELTSILKIIQSKEVFSFSIDAVLLAHFSTVPKKGKIIDLCSGNGVIPLLLSQMTKAQIYGIEIQDRLVDMSKRSIEINNLTQQIDIINANIKEAPKLLGKDKFDLVTVNPPYMQIIGQDRNINMHHAIAKHEILTDLKEVINISGQLLKVGGKLAMVHRASRFADITTFLRNERLEPKRIRFVHPNKSKEANMVLIEAIKHGGMEAHVLPPLIVYKDKEVYSDEIYQMYFGNVKEDQHFIYVLECSDDTYYTGYTNSIEERLKKHQSGKGSKYTRGRRPVKLIYFEELASKSLALKREIEIKGFTRLQKEMLIKKDDKNGYPEKF